MPKPIKAFVAKSFADEDEARLQPLLKFLDTFKPLGVVFESADRAEAEGVSDKVRRMIYDAIIFVVIFTKRFPICETREQSVFPVSPPKWIPPLWLLQEAGYALAKEKKMIFFVETGVEVPQLAGDHEYIRYDSQDPSESYTRAGQMLGAIISKELSLILDTSLVQEGQASAAPDPFEPSPTASIDKPDQPGGLEEFIKRMFESLDSGSLQDLKRAEADGLDYVRRHEPEREPSWRTFCLRQRIESGDTEAVNELRALSDELPTSSGPLTALGMVYRGFGNHAEALDFFKRAAAIEYPKDRTWAITMQSRCYQDLGQFEEALAVAKSAQQKPKRQIALLCLRGYTTSTRLRVNLARHSALVKSAFFKMAHSRNSISRLLTTTTRAILKSSQRITIGLLSN